MPTRSHRVPTRYIDAFPAAATWLSGGCRWICGAVVLVIALAASAQSMPGRGVPDLAPQPPVLSHTTRAARFLRGRSAGESRSAAEWLALARREHAWMLAQPRTANLAAAWSAVGPAQVLSATYGALTGRVTALAIDPDDATGNTVYVGTTGGGVWKSLNAAGPAASVSFLPLTDTLPAFSANAGSSATASLSIGALGLGNGILLAGTGDPNDASDSYYGSGLLRSADGGTTWTLVQGSQDGVAGNHSFFGLSFAGFAFSSKTPSLVVAAVTQAAEGVLVNAPDQSNSVKGLYFSPDAGVTWKMASIYDGSQPVQTPQPSGGNGGGNAATAVVWNPVRGMFYAAVQFHGYYQSPDGQTWTRLAHQPGTGLTPADCPTDPGSTGNPNCPIFRGALAVQPVTGDTFALTTDRLNEDQGLWQDVCNLQSSACADATVLFATELAAPGSSPLEEGNGSTVIPQADYNLTLAAAAAGPGSGNDTIVYAGTTDLFRCSLAAGCTLRNTTNAQNGCTNPAGVAGSQHALATLSTTGGPLLFLGNDGGIYRSSDGANESGAPCSADDASHFQNLNPGLGSLAEVVSFAQHPSDPATLLAGLGALGTTGTGGGVTAWPQLATGEGGTVAIDPANPLNWFISTGAGVSILPCTSGAACSVADFSGQPVIGPAQIAGDASELDAPWILDPAQTSNVAIGTCRMWRGPAASGASWPGANGLSRPFGASSASACSASFPVIRSLAAGGPDSSAGAAANQGSERLYAGLAGSLDGGGGLGGHLFTTAAANSASSTTVWTDAALAPVSNDVVDAGVFNPGGFDISSVTADAHDASGMTVYATVMGFARNGINAPHVYRSADGGGHWTNISSNLPNAPANSLVVDPNDANTVYVALDTGVYVTTGVTDCASANCWSVYGTALPNAPVVQLQAASAMATGDGRTGELRAATDGRGIWQIPLLTAVSPLAPGLSASPSSLDFGSQQVGTSSAPQTVTVTNTGSAPLTVSGVVASGDFHEADSCVGSPVAPGATCAVQVTFLPAASGTGGGVLTVYGNAPGGQATVTLTGNGTAAAAIVLTPVTLSFPATTVHAASAVQNITVSNTGAGIASLQSETVTGDFAIVQNTCGPTLAANTGCTVSLTFTPTIAGSRGGSFTVVDSAGTQTASLSGTGDAAATDGLAPGSLSFSAQTLNTSSATQLVTLTNSGDVPLTLIAAQITEGDFTVVNGCGPSLNGHASCALAVAFAPKSLGMQSGVLSVTDALRIQTVSLNGTGIAPAGVSLAPANGLVFAATGVGSTTATQTVTLTNNGGLPLNVTGLTVTGDFFLQAGSNTCGASVAGGMACTVQVGFAPTAGGPRTGLLTVTSNAVASPQSMGLSGAGVDFTLAADGPVAATITSGQSATFALLVSSVAGVPGSATLVCTGAPAEALCTVNPASASLGGSTAVTVTLATGVSAVGQSAAPRWRRGLAAVWAMLAPLCLLRLARRRTPRVACALLLGLGLAGASGCGTARTIPAATGGSGGGGSVVTTPPGSYTLLVAGTSAGLARSVSLHLTVQ
jgi:hypothetical protein